MSESSCCHCTGPGYPSPEEAFLNGQREKYMFVACPHIDQSKPDRLVTVDTDPESPTYSSIVSKIIFPNIGDEVHHTGWNSCSSCYNNANVERKYLVLPCLNTSRIYFVDTTYPTNLKLHKTIEPATMLAKNVSFPHTAHCLGDGNIMISVLGDADYEGKGDFLLVNGKTFEVIGTWAAEDSEKPQFNYDFWYQPRRNVMISTEWGIPKRIKRGFKAGDILKSDVYGHRIHVWDWEKRRLKQTIELDVPNGITPFEIRFLHNPESTHGYFCCPVGSSLYHFHKPEGEENFTVEKVENLPAKPLKDWLLPEIPPFISDILLSMDDKFLYASCWLHGEIRQYNITNPNSPKLVGQIFIGGYERPNLQDDEAYIKGGKRVRELKGKIIDGGPQMLQLSLDGKRLYTTTSLYSLWDKQFFPNMAKTGSKMLQIYCDTKSGGLTLNENFLVDFGEMEDGPFFAHEMRYPGGDCTSDIWI